MLERAAVIDLGTNTFHLIIAELQEGSLEIVFRQRHYVFLGKDGVETINKDRYDDGIRVIREFKSILENFDVRACKVLGTSALRSASNGPDFVNQVSLETGLNIEIIDGITEADYIFKGIILAKQEDEDNHLIMDIGGGSVELVLFKKQDIIYSDSFSIGISVLHAVFQDQDPITDQAILSLDEHLMNTLKPMLEVLDNYQIRSLIGASGSFEVLKKLQGLSPSLNCHSISKDFFKLQLKRMLELNLSERLKIKRLDDERAQLIQLAFLLIDFILKKTGINEILVSPYAMKEGAIWEMIKK